MSNEDYLRLATVDNFRDVAGDGYATTDGGRVRTGVFFRSNELRLSGPDLATLTGLGLTAIIDLRSQGEIDRHPDPAVDGADWLHFDLFGIPMERVAAVRTVADAEEIMETVYRGFVDDEHSRAQLGNVLRQLSTGAKQLFHCTAGKDRTGWTAALLLHIAGVDDATIASDYLLTNARSAASRARLEASIVEAAGPERAAVFAPTLIADMTFLRAASDAVQASYGDRERYLRDGLGLDDETLGRLRALLRD
ncbi:tyrosine-protein phosphatase [Nocardioides sambongensis]|uniref:tyrosine-protein phosphatase n=1 Tax=Nocardioides sambongensis TaxID=2589074 RepID=UPI001129949D|nr:tyrosine-protein phosphatase [Nocardioides sambongensis]